MKLSVVIPAYNEEGSITETVTALYKVLHRENIEHELVVINDNSKDRTLIILEELQHSMPTLEFYTNHGLNGFGYAVRYGLERFTGDCVAVFMADLSDDPEAPEKFYRTMVSSKCNSVCASLCIRAGQVIDYPATTTCMNSV